MHDFYLCEKAAIEPPKDTAVPYAKRFWACHHNLYSIQNDFMSDNNENSNNIYSDAKLVIPICW